MIILIAIFTGILLIIIASDLKKVKEEEKEINKKLSEL
jgi:hypothetical protein